MSTTSTPCWVSTWEKAAVMPGRSAPDTVTINRFLSSAMAERPPGFLRNSQTCPEPAGLTGYLMMAKPGPGHKPLRPGPGQGRSLQPSMGDLAW